MNTTYSTIPDQELLNRFYHDGDNKWLGQLLQRYTVLLYGVCMKYLKNEEEAKDAVQQVFVVENLQREEQVQLMKDTETKIEQEKRTTRWATW